MRYWYDMFDKYGFNDGESVPKEAWLSRTVYVATVNKLAEQMGSNTRAISYNRPGMHNSVLIVKVPVEWFNRLSRSDQTLDWDYPVPAGHTPDEVWVKVVDRCQELGLDDYVICQPRLDHKFKDLLKDVLSDWRLRQFSDNPASDGFLV